MNGSYITIPRELYTLGFYSKLSNDAILLYGILLNRFKLSKKTGMKDKSGRIFVMASIESIMKMLKISKGKARKVLNELVNLLLLKIEKMEGFNNKRRLYLGIVRKEDDMFTGDRISSCKEVVKESYIVESDTYKNRDYQKNNKYEDKKQLTYSYLKEFDFED